MKKNKVAINKTILFIVSLLPLLYLLLNILVLQQSPDPAKEVILFTGIWSFNFLLLTLTVTPLANIFKFVALKRYRRMLGLFSFFYVFIHLLAVMFFLMGWSLDIFWIEFTQRPYMTYGILAFVLMLPLALTSNKYASSWLKRKWQLLHYLIYPAVILVALHYWLQVRSDVFQPAAYFALAILLLVYRFYVFLTKRYS